MIVYLIISAVTAIFQWKIEGNAFLHTRRTKVDCCSAQSEPPLVNALHDTVLLYQRTAMHCQPLQSLLNVSRCLQDLPPLKVSAKLPRYSDQWSWTVRRADAADPRWAMYLA